VSNGKYTGKIAVVYVNRCYSFYSILTSFNTIDVIHFILF
jgi:hypothetical protein